MRKKLLTKSAFVRPNHRGNISVASLGDKTVSTFAAGGTGSSWCACRGEPSHASEPCAAFRGNASLLPPRTLYFPATVNYFVAQEQL